MTDIKTIAYWIASNCYEFAYRYDGEVYWMTGNLERDYLMVLEFLEDFKNDN